MSLGNYPGTSLADARRMVKEFRAQITLGRDPQGEKVERKRGAIKAREDLELAWTMSRLCDEYFSRYVEHRVKHPQIVKARMENDIKPVLGSRLVTDIRPHQIDALIKGIVARNAPSMANNTLRLLKKMFNLAIKLEVTEANPANVLGLEDAGGTAKPRDRSLTKDELATFLTAVTNTPGVGHQNIITLKLLLLLCVRKQELTQAKIEEFDLAEGLWSLPAARTKTGKAIDIPLSDWAVELISELKEMAWGGVYLLPARKAQERMLPHIHEATLNVALAKVLARMDVPRFTIHDLRRTSRTHLSALGISSFVAERCLNHTLKGVEGIYDRHDFYEERKEALQKWSDFLRSLTP